MAWRRYAAVCAWLLLLPAHALASAWPQAAGHTEIIASLEPGGANHAYDASGEATAIRPQWDQTDAYIYIDQGLSSRLSLTGRVNFKAYDTGDTRFTGLSSVELGARYALHHGNVYVVSVGASLEGLGKGRRNDFDDLFGRQGTDAELRLYVGRNLRLMKTSAFLDLQAARKFRQYNPDQWRVDATLGLRPSVRWMVLAQAFAGRTDRNAAYEAEWVNAELSLVRRLDLKHDAFVQMGVRRTVLGRNVPEVTALTMSLWRRY